MTLCSSNIFNNSNVSALDYSSNVGVGFTFNPSLSISISSADLVIDNLVPGSVADSNDITINVSTNAAYGYTLSATADSSDLIHTNETNTFSGIATDASLESLTMDNTWGYSYKNNTASSPTWSNYSGLATNINKVLFNTDNNTTSSIDFKIAAKASNTQPSGEYTGTITFVVVSKVAPMSLLDSFIASGAEQLNGYYKMQDMTHDICEAIDVEESELQLIDVRDNKVYWVAKLKDENCWMTQNLDLDLSSSIALTSDNTDLSTDTSLYVQDSTNGPYALDSGYTMNTVKDKTVVSWTPERSTYTSTAAPGANNWAGDTGDNTTSGYYHPYSWNRIKNKNGDPVYPDSTVTEAAAGNHAQSGNYYNWSAAIASNYSYAASGSQKNSICPSGWRLPVNGEYGALYNVSKTPDNTFNNAYGLMTEPLWFMRSGGVVNGMLYSSNVNGFYWSSTILDSNHNHAHSLFFTSSSIYPNNSRERSYGLSLRCTIK